MANVLIVDDDAALREGLAETVADLGHVPLTAASGREALAESAAVMSIAYCSICECRAAWTALQVLRRIREQRGRPAGDRPDGVRDRREHNRGDAAWRVRSSDEAGRPSGTRRSS